jgi:hypothetical protein
LTALLPGALSGIAFQPGVNGNQYSPAVDIRITLHRAMPSVPAARILAVPVGHSHRPSSRGRHKEGAVAMRSASEQASGYQRDPRRAGASAAYDPYAASYYTQGFTALAGWLLILGGCWSFFVGLAIAVRKFYFAAQPGYYSASHYYAYHWNLSGWAGRT